MSLSLYNPCLGLSMLQAWGKDLEMVGDSEPKYNANLAGRGIDYTWGLTNGKYYWILLDRKLLLKRIIMLWNKITILIVRMMDQAGMSIHLYVL